MPQDNPAADSPPDAGDLAKAFQELAKGERTASAMESQLTALERRIDDLLASVDEQDPGVETKKQSSGAGSSNQDQDAKA